MNGKEIFLKKESSGLWNVNTPYKPSFSCHAHVGDLALVSPVRVSIVSLFGWLDPRRMTGPSI